MRIKKLFASIAFLGFILMLTELNGGPWSGTYIGLAMFILGSTAALRIKRKKFSKRGLHRSIYHHS